MGRIDWVVLILYSIISLLLIFIIVLFEDTIDHLPQGEMEEMAVMVVVMEMAVEEMICHHHQIKGSHDTIKIKETDRYM